MENIYLFITVLFIVFGILQIILFFKLWGMTNDVRAMKEKMYEKSKVQRVIENGKAFHIDDTVIEIESGRQMTIKEIKENKYCCYVNGTVCVGNFEESQIRKA